MKLNKWKEKCKIRAADAKGFTLVEMIVVLAIIAILIALIAPNVARLIGNAQETSDSATAKSIMTASQSYATEALAGKYKLATTAKIPTGVSDIPGVGTGAPRLGVVAEITDTVTGTPPVAAGDTLMKSLFIGPDGTTKFSKPFMDDSGDALLRIGTIGVTGKAYVYFSPKGAVTGVILCGGETVETILAVTGSVPKSVLGTTYKEFNNTTLVGKTMKSKGLGIN